MLAETTTLVESAVEWTKNGYSVFPVEPRGKRPLVKWTLYSDAPAPMKQIVRWFRNDLNMAVICGGEKQLAVVDYDTQTGYYKALSMLDPRLRGIIERTYKVKTGRGVHAYFNCETRCRKNVDLKIDIKGRGGYVLVPPSTHPSGSLYTPIHGAMISDIQQISPEDLYTMAALADEEPEAAVYDPNSHSKSVFDLQEDSLGFMNDFDLVLANVPILRVALRLTPMFSRGSGRYWMGVCPVHKDTAPSFWVDTQLGIAKCYSTACRLNDKAVNVIGLWSIARNISYTEAMLELLGSV